MLNSICEFWLRRTTREYWVVYSYHGWLAFKNRDKALRSAFFNRCDLYRHWWSEADNKWAGQTDMELYEIDALRNL
jgi:hypothetical protein